MPVPNVLPEPLYIGLKLSELVTLIGIIVGPIVAVVITLITESKRRKRDGRIHVMRMLLNTRHIPADPAYSIAINLVPVEFNGSKKIMGAWSKYIETVRLRVPQESQHAHSKLINAKQTALIYQIMNNLGFKLSETDIQTSAYISQGHIDRDDLYLDSLKATRDIANQMKQQNEFIQASVTGQSKDRSLIENKTQ